MPSLQSSLCLCVPAVKGLPAAPLCSCHTWLTLEGGCWNAHPWLQGGGQSPFCTASTARQLPWRAGWWTLGPGRRPNMPSCARPCTTRPASRRRCAQSSSAPHTPCQGLCKAIWLSRAALRSTLPSCLTPERRLASMRCDSGSRQSQAEGGQAGPTGCSCAAQGCCQLACQVN